jgi:hypothetical protein
MMDEKENINARSWDPITATGDGGVVWKSTDGLVAVTHGDETPEQVAEPAADADAAIAALAALAGDVGNAENVKFTVLSPDGLPIAPEEYGSRAAAEAALAAWCERFTSQGYYAAVGERISLADLPARCSIVVRKVEDSAVCCPCPNCCEANPDRLAWQDDDETVRCLSCGHEYKP